MNSASFVKKTKFSPKVRANVNTITDILDSAYRTDGITVQYRTTFANIRLASAVAKSGNMAERALELCVDRGYSVSQVGDDLIIKVPHQ